MAHPNEELARESAAAFQRGDLEALRNKYFAADIRWHVPGRGPLAGTYEGVDEVLAVFGRLFELTNGTYTVEVHDVLANDEHAVTLLGQRAERGGSVLTDNAIVVSHIRDGKLAEVWTVQTDLYASDELLS